VESLLSLAEMTNEYNISHEDILAVIRPSGPTINSVVSLMARLVAKPKEGPLPEPPTESKVEELPEEVAY
jgi:hypothetical protein